MPAPGHRRRETPVRVKADQPAAAANNYAARASSRSRSPRQSPKEAAESLLQKAKEEFRPARIAAAIQADACLLTDLYPNRNECKSPEEAAAFLIEAYDLPFPVDIVATNIVAGAMMA